MASVKRNTTSGRGPDDELGEVANRIFFRLYQAANMMHKTGTRALDEHGVTTQQWAVIGALSRPQADRGMTMGELARFLMVSRQNLTGVIARLEAQHYLDRERDEADGRSRLIKLSASGRKVWKSITPAIYDYYENALSGFTIEERSGLAANLARLIGNMTRLDRE